MKTRNGFVSNSSSSSFVVITTKECHEEAMSKMPEFEQAVIKQLGCTKNKFMGMDMIAIETWCTSGCSCFEDVDVENSFELLKDREGITEDNVCDWANDLKHEALDKYVDAIPEDKKMCYSVDM